MNSKHKAVLSYIGVGILTLTISAIFILLTGSGVTSALSGFFNGIFGSTYNIAEVFVKATPLILTGLGVAVGFHCGFTNIGAEGQLYMGAIASTFLALSFPSLPGILLIPLCIIGAFVCGGFWALIPGVLKAKFGISEVINTIMFNYIAINLVGILLQTVMKDPKGFYPVSPPIPEASVLPVLVPRSRLHAGFILAVIAAILVYILIYQTIAGYKMRTVGANIRASRCSGISCVRNIMLSSIISGGIAGIAGYSEVAGLHHRLLEGISPNYGYMAIIVALLGKNHPLGIVVSAIGIAALQVGSLSMQRATNVPASLALIIMGALVLLLLARKEIFKFLLKTRKGTV